MHRDRIWFLIMCAWIAQPALLLGQSFDDLTNRFSQAYNAGRYAEAEAITRQLVSVAEKQYANRPEIVAAAYNNRGLALAEIGKQADAKAAHLLALQIREKVFSTTDERVLESVSNLGSLYEEMGLYDDAEKLHRRALEGREKKLGPNDLLVAGSLNNLAMVLVEQRRYEAATEAYQRSLKIKRAKLGEQHIDVAKTLNNLGTVSYTQGKWKEAEEIFRSALKIYERQGPDHPRITSTLNNLASALMEQKRFAEAEPHYVRTLKIRRASYGDSHPEVALSMNNLALLYQHQNRMAEAEPLFKKSLLMRQEHLGTDHPAIIANMTTLADYYLKTGRLNDAEPLLKRVLRTQLAAPDVHAVALATTLNRYGNLKELQNNIDDAIDYYRRAIDAQQKVAGDGHRETRFALLAVAKLYRRQDKNAEAEAMVSRVISAQQPGTASPDELFQSHDLRSQIRKSLGRTSDALDDAQAALRYAELQQAVPPLNSEDIPASFVPYADAFSRVIQWQAEAGDVAAAIATAERLRGQALLEQIRAAKINPLSGVDASQSTVLRKSYAEAQTRVRSLMSEYDAVQSRQDLSDTVRSSEITRLTGELSDARTAAVTAYRAIHQSSGQRPFVPAEGSSFNVSAWQIWSKGRKETIFYYLIGADSSYLVRISPGESPSLTPLLVDKELADRLKLESGPLREEGLNNLLRGGSQAVMRCIPGGEDTPAVRQQLHNLWLLLLPAAEREAIVSGKVPHLVIVPDGPLLNLPFETLIVNNTAKPQYLLDVETIVTYAPSLAVFQHLGDQQTQHSKIEQVSVLTLGDPRYPAVAVQTTEQSRSWTTAGRLQSLPHTGNETDLLKRIFTDHSFDVTQLRGEQATEKSIRAHLKDRTLLHFACHGLVDQDLGNLFGALAVTPGPVNNADPRNDGLLTLAELNELDLKKCDLAILSACETNYGPQQKGEGVWAISRGLLVGGSRRVVASNWLVDDEATSNLIALFCAGVADDLKNGTLQSGQRLRQAKRTLRAQEKWAAPFYWAPFVQLGPN